MDTSQQGMWKRIPNKWETTAEPDMELETKSRVAFSIQKPRNCGGKSQLDQELKQKKSEAQLKGDYQQHSERVRKTVNPKGCSQVPHLRFLFSLKVIGSLLKIPSLPSACLELGAEF